MGNKTSQFKTDLHTSPGSTKNLQPIISEEDYLPMPRSMRKSLLDGRKIKRVLPTRINRIEKENNVLERGESFHGNAMSKKENMFENNDVSEFSVQIKDAYGDNNTFGNVTSEYSSYKVTPVVTVIDQVEVDAKSKSLPNTRVDDETDMSANSLDYSTMKIHATNRKYSLIDMRTGLKKSRFTLDLEDKLRNTKRKFGFDSHLSGWKEFSYKVEKSREDGRKNQSLERGIHASSIDTGNANKGFSKRSNGSVEFCTHNYQILGLCSVGRPQPFRNKNQFEASLFHDKIIIGDNENKLIKTHSKKVGCPCDLCTLAFLTDMNCHGGRSASVKRRSKNSLSNSDRSNRLLKEKIRIMDQRNGKTAIEISVRTASPDTQSSLLSNCSMLSTETREDCTNSRIRNMFKENDKSDIREIYTNPKSNYNDISIDELTLKSTERFDTSSIPGFVKKITSNVISQTNFKNKYRKSSSSTTTTSFASSSSLSTVMSYRRVRQIFQTIIEGNRMKKRTKVDVHKFKEMEELGLGRWKNNRWYPSEGKAFSIWKDMHENAQGLQGEFKKYQKTIN